MNIKRLNNYLNLHVAQLILSIVLFSSLFSGCSLEQDENFMGSIHVQLVNSDKSEQVPFDNIVVNITNTTDNSSRSAITDASGSINFNTLPVGAYEISLFKLRPETMQTITGNLKISLQPQQDMVLDLPLQVVSQTNDFVIKEVYHNGPADGTETWFKDQFIEIFNNSNETLYADGLYIASAFESDRESSSQPLSQQFNLEENIYVELLERIPGNGTDYPISPGKSFIVALNAFNFKADNPRPEKAIDNSSADFERYTVKWLEERSLDASMFFDFDNPDVTNTIPLFMEPRRQFWLMNAYGPGMIIFRHDNLDLDNHIIYKYGKAGSTLVHEANLLKIPTSNVIDGVEILANSQIQEWKKLPSSVDDSYICLNPDGQKPYTSQSIRRKVNTEASELFGRLILMDSNSSNHDMEVIPLPDPRGYDNFEF